MGKAVTAASKWWLPSAGARSEAAAGVSVSGGWLRCWLPPRAPDCYWVADEFIFVLTEVAFAGRGAGGVH